MCARVCMRREGKVSKILSERTREEDGQMAAEREGLGTKKRSTLTRSGACEVGRVYRVGVAFFSPVGGAGSFRLESRDRDTDFGMSSDPGALRISDMLLRLSVALHNAGINAHGNDKM